MSLPVLYSFRRCPYAMRARLAIQVAGVRCELREVVLRDKPIELRRVSSKATVPVLVINKSEVIDESLDIAIWALTQNDPDNWLTPDPCSYAEMIVFIERIEAQFKYHLDRYKYAWRFEARNEEKHRNFASTFLKKIEERLNRHSWICGRRRSLADIALLPFVRQFAHVDRPWFDGQDWPQVIRWLSEFETSTEFVHIMEKHAQWHSGDAPLQFP